MAMTLCAQQLRMVEDAPGHGDCIGMAGFVRLWSEVLEVPDVEADDDFFNLGGNSLRAVQMLAELSRLTSLRFTTRVLYENPTPAAFHEHLHAHAA